MKKIALTLLITLSISLPCLADAESYADSLIQRHCPAPGKGIINSGLCIDAYQVKTNILILKELKELKKEVESIKSQDKQ